MRTRELCSNMEFGAALHFTVCTHAKQFYSIDCACTFVTRSLLQSFYMAYRIYRTAVKLYNLNRCVIYMIAAWNCWWKWNSRTVYVKKKAVAREKPMHAWQCTMHGLESMSKETRHPYISTNEIPPFVKVLCVLIILLKSESPRADVVCSYIYHVFVYTYIAYISRTHYYPRFHP